MDLRRSLDKATRSVRVSRPNPTFQVCLPVMSMLKTIRPRRARVLRIGALLSWMNNAFRVISCVTEFMVRILEPGRSRRCLCTAALIIVATVAGCYSGDKQTSPQVRIAELDATKQYLSDEVKKLQTENARLKQELALTKKELADLSVHTDKVRQLNSAMLNDTQALRSTLEKLKAEHEKLVIENIELKKELAERGKPTTVASAVGPRKGPPVSSQKMQPAVEEKSSTPCDAIVQLVQRCEAVVRNYKGDEQRQKLRTLRAQFRELTKSAPADAAESLNSWLADLSRLSTDPLDAAMFPLFVRKNAILKACVKTE